MDGLSLLPELIGEKAAGHKQACHEFLYWEIGGWTAIRQGNWRAVKPGKNAPWELYDLAKDPSESKDLAAAHPDVLAGLVTLAEKAHEPAREGTFARTDRHERNRRAKFGKQDDPSPEAKPARGKKKSPKPAAQIHAMPTQGLLSNKGWKIVRVSSENTANGKFARNAIDGDPATLWHTKFSGGAAPPPHELVIDLGAEHTIRGFVYLGRQDAGWNGAVKDVEFCIGNSPDTFPAPVVRTALSKTKAPQEADFAPTKGRYVLFRVINEHSPNRFATVAELGIIGQ